MPVAEYIVAGKRVTGSTNAIIERTADYIEAEGYALDREIYLGSRAFDRAGGA